MDLKQDRSPNLRIVNILFLSLAASSCILRWYTRLFVVKGFGADDWLMMLAVSFYILYVVSGLISANHGSGRHQSTLSKHDLSIAMQQWWLCYLWYDFCMIFARLSIGIFFLRLTVKRFHLYLIYLIMISTVGFGLIFMGVAIGECTPPSYFWDKTIDGGSCMDSKIIVALMYLYSSSSLFSDATYAIFPIFLIRGLQMDKRTKYALMPILGLGWMSVDMPPRRIIKRICALTKLSYRASIAVLIRYAYLTTLASADFTYDALTIAILSSSEQGLAITAGNLATLRPLFTRKFRLWESDVRHSSASGPQPPKSIALDRVKRRVRSSTCIFRLTAFIDAHTGDEEKGMSPDSIISAKPNGINVMTGIAVTSQRMNHADWDVNNAPGELRPHLSSETLGGEDRQAVPTSFLAKGEGDA